MSNICENMLIVTGDATLVDAFADAARATAVTRDGPNAAEAGVTSLSLDALVPTPELPPSDTLDDWREKNWGCRDDIDAAAAARAVIGETGVAVYRFESVWGPPDPFLVTTSAKFPTLDFHLVGLEFGCMGCAVFRYRAGERAWVTVEPSFFVTQLPVAAVTLTGARIVVDPVNAPTIETVESDLVDSPDLVRNALRDRLAVDPGARCGVLIDARPDLPIEDWDPQPVEIDEGMLARLVVERYGRAWAADDRWLQVSDWLPALLVEHARELTGETLALLTVQFACCFDLGWDEAEPLAVRLVAADVDISAALRMIHMLAGQRTGIGDVVDAITGALMPPPHSRT